MVKELIRRGESGGQVSDWNPSSDTITAPSQQSFFAPFGLTLRQTITSSGAVTIPAGIEWVYVVMTGGGSGGWFGFGGMAAEVSWGWTLAQNSCIIGAGGASGGTNGGNGGYTRYGHIIAKGGITDARTGSANYYGQPGGNGYGNDDPRPGFVGANAGGGGQSRRAGINGANGANGISGGGGGHYEVTNGGSGGNGGSGLVGGGGGGTSTTSGIGIGGNGGNGLGIDGTVYIGGTGFTATNFGGTGGGGAGMAGNGTNAISGFAGTGGLGGGAGGGAGNVGGGGAGILYIFY